MFITDIFEMALDPNNTETSLTFENITFVETNTSSDQKLNYKHSEFLISKYDSSYFNFNDTLGIVIDKDITFFNCKFQSINIGGFSFLGRLVFFGSKFETLWDPAPNPPIFHHCYFSAIDFIGEVTDDQNEILFTNSYIRDIFYSPAPSLNLSDNIIEHAHLEPAREDVVFHLENNRFKPILQSPLFEIDSSLYSANYGREMSKEILRLNGGYGDLSSPIRLITLIGNSFDSKIPNSPWHISISNLQIKDLSIIENKMEVGINIQNSSIDNRCKIYDNSPLSGFSLLNTTLTEQFNVIPWDQLIGFRLYSMYELPSHENSEGNMVTNFSTYRAEVDEELSNKSKFESLMASYRRLFDVYKQRGDIEGANGCYAEMKELEGRRLKYLSKTEGGLGNFFKWQLNQLMKMYTEHGTDPSKAMVISFYIILIFAMFYFFFPSEWDITSKHQLIATIKEAVDKNQPGTAKSVVKSIGLLFLSFFNAVTLSLNSFITLGFGTIPTTGLARYVCILQGFLGWFLLSLFTVALINQVLF